MQRCVFRDQEIANKHISTEKYISLTPSSLLALAFVPLLPELLLFRQKPASTPSVSTARAASSASLCFEGGIMLSTSRILLMRLVDCGFRAWNLRTFCLRSSDSRVRSWFGLRMRSIQASHSQKTILTWSEISQIEMYVSKKQTIPRALYSDAWYYKISKVNYTRHIQGAICEGGVGDCSWSRF